jgi:hypothetical protein
MSSFLKIDKNLFPTSIFPYLGPHGTALCGSTCKYLRTQASSERLWEYFFKKTFGEAPKPYTFTYQQEYRFLQTRITANISRRVFHSVNCEGLQDGLRSFTISHFQIDWQGRIVLADIQGGRAIIFIPPPKGQTSWERLPIAIGRPVNVYFSSKGELVVRHENGIQKTFTFVNEQFVVITNKCELKKDKEENQRTSPPVALSPGGKMIFAGVKNELEVYRNGNKVYTLTDKEQVRFVHFTEDGRLFVVLGENKIQILQFCIPLGTVVWEKGASFKAAPNMTLQEAMRKMANRDPYFEGIKSCPMSLLEIAEEFARLSEEDRTWTKEFLFDHVKALPNQEQEQIFIELLLTQYPSLAREVAATKIAMGMCSFFNKKEIDSKYHATNAQRSAAIFHFLPRREAARAAFVRRFFYKMVFGF